MLKLIPAVKQLEFLEGEFSGGGVCYSKENVDARVLAALNKLPYDPNGVAIDISHDATSGEGYELWIDAEGIRIRAEGPAGAFYAVQTLRQIFKHDVIPHLYIKDAPDFPHRGFYHLAHIGVITVDFAVDCVSHILHNLDVVIFHQSIIGS